MPVPEPSAQYSRRRWLQFSLRSLLVLVFACGGGLGMWSRWLEPYRRQRRLEAEVQKLGGMIDTGTVDTWWARLFGSRFFSHVLEIGFFERPQNEAWLARLRDVPHLRGLYLQDTPVSDEVLTELGQLRELKQLSLAGSGVTDSGIERLLTLDKLEVLELIGARITDAGVGQLVSLPSLGHLSLDDNDITEASLPHFRALPNLTRLTLSGTHIVPSALREALPHLDAWEIKFLLEHAQIQKRFTDTRLIDIMDWFRECHIDMALDGKSSRELGIDLQSRFTITVTHTPLGTALPEAFEPLGLKCLIRHGVVMLTTREEPGDYPVRLSLKRGEKLARKLSKEPNSRATLQFSNTPLVEVLEFLFEQRGIDIRMDEPVPTAVGESLITCALDTTATANALGSDLPGFGPLRRDRGQHDPRLRNTNSLMTQGFDPLVCPRRAEMIFLGFSSNGLRQVSQRHGDCRLHGGL